MLCQFCKKVDRQFNALCPNPECKAHNGFMLPDIDTIQKQVGVWHEHNFGPTAQHHCIYGMIEELGELCHAILKQEQGIRITNAENVKDAIGDLMIFTMDLCNHLNLNLYNVIYETWQEVRKRDWKQFPINGVDK